MAFVKTFTIPRSFEEEQQLSSASEVCPDSHCKLPPHQTTLRTKATIVTLRRLTKAAMSLVSCMLNEKALIYQLELALYEACSNVIRHAYTASDQGELQVSVEICPLEHITFEITDWGNGFDCYPVKLHTPLPEEEDGRGLLIIRGLADDLSICRKDGSTTLRMRFQIEEDRWRTCELLEEEAG